jgi:hypothetical protein
MTGESEMKKDTRDAALHLLLLGFTHEIRNADELTVACQHAFTIWNDDDCPQEQIQWPVIHWFQTYLQEVVEHASCSAAFASNHPSWSAWGWCERLYASTHFRWERPENWWYNTFALLSDPAA